MNFKENLEIDAFNLDSEWLNQPCRFFDVSEQLADAKKELDLVKLSLEVTEAELYKDVKENPDNYGLDKVTEKAIDACVKDSNKYKDAVKEVIDKKHEVDIFSSAVTAFEHRKKALENLVYLQTQQYYAEPKTSKSNEEKVEKNSIRRKIKERLNKEDD